MTLITQLIPPTPTQVVEPKQRRRWHRERRSQAERKAAEARLDEELRRKRAETARRMAEAQDELSAKSAKLPSGIRIVGQDQVAP